jgi:zinc transport system substrate-binding protein
MTGVGRGARRFAGLFLTVALCLHLPLPPAAGAEPMPVFVSILPQKYLVERIAGERVNVSVMVGPGASPATYEPTPRQMALFSEASIYFRIGVPFEKIWIERLADVNREITIVHTSESVMTRELENHVGRDPHVWTSPLLTGHIARTMTDALIAAAPEHRSEFEQNYARLASDLARLDAGIREIFGHVKQRKFMVFHPSWGYFADSYGLEQVAIEENGREPTASRLAALIDDARRDGIRVIFVQKHFSRRNAEAVAGEIGAEVITVDPLAEDYITNLQSLAALFAEAMQ